MPRTSKADSDKKKVGERVRYWLAEIEASRKREDDYRTTGKRVREIYDGTLSDTTPMNILYSNTETIMPSMYSQVPRPVVQRRYKDNDQVGMAAAKAAQRMLEFQLDTNIEGYETFHESMKAATLDGLLPGRGVTGLNYDADVTGDVKQSELICTDSKSWDRFYHGYARKWSNVPWIAYEQYVDKEEATELFGKEIAGDIEYTTGEENPKDGKSGHDQDTGERKTALIYQIWDKRGGRKIRYVSPHYTEDYLKVADDSLQLTGFFNCPKPLQFLDKTDNLTPTSLYTLYENQAEELNRLTRRIGRISEAIKARGLYTGDVSADIENLMEADDNKLVPIETQAGAAGEKALSNAIWFMPLDILITVLRELYSAREACKQVIYEITGISDIVRGASKASETLGAQQIKSQWGTLRIKPKQAEVQRYARDLLRMTVEIAALKFSQDTWARMTGLPYLTDQQVMQAKQMMQAAQIQMQQLQQQAAMQQQAQGAAMAQQPVQPNPAAPQAPLPPQPVNGAAIQLQQAQQQLQQSQQQLQETPKWADILKVLQDDLQRAYKIDIETNSTVEPEAAEDQQNIADLMTAIGQFLNGVGPLVAQGVMPFQVAQSMLLAITRRFRFGDEIEDQIKQMQPPPQEDPSKGEAQKAQQQAQQSQQSEQATKMQATGDKIQANAQIAQLQTQLKELQSASMLKDRETAVQLREMHLKQDEQMLKLERQAATESVTNKVQVENTKLDHKKQITGLEQKQAKTDQNVSKTVDSKLSQAVQSQGQMISQLVSAIEDQVKSTQELIQTVKAPRKRTAIRGKDGRIESQIDEVMQ